MIPGDVPQWIVLFWLFLFGATIGSFLNVCIYRLPKFEEQFSRAVPYPCVRESVSGWQSLTRRLWLELIILPAKCGWIVRGTAAAWSGVSNPPSSCPFCRQRIKWYDNIPIFGWLLLWGRCRFCRHSIPIRYALIELLNGALFVLLYWMIVPAGFSAKISDSCLWTSIGPLSDSRLPLAHLKTAVTLQFLYFLVLTEALLVATFIDFDLQIIPDSVTLPAAIVGFGGAVCFPHLWLTPVWLDWFRVPAWIAAYPWLHAVSVSVAGALVGGGMIWVVRIIGQWILRQEAMGFGDVILMAMVGSYVGWQATVLIFLFAPAFALAVIAVQWLSRRVHVIPYGPYLSLATLFVILCWQPLWNRLHHVFELGPWLGIYVVVMTILLIVSLFIVQGVKRLLGIPLYPPDGIEEWTSADQLAFFASYDRDAGRGSLQRTEWPGAAAAQGRQQNRPWRR